MTARDQLVAMFRVALPGRPVTWTSERTSKGDFEGRDVTLEIFDVPSAHRRSLLRDLRPQREKAAELLGRPMQLVFHTPAEARAQPPSAKPG